ncbi:succinylglutamate desuccinylase/aspartoacylase family protein [Candidatus Gottesmanbacteria bacterium]|nr:succinylglutamate desuccinylase/aspartoacylase family protein [Candidatus Gottesmanbacteria bacterium]
MNEATGFVRRETPDTLVRAELREHAIHYPTAATLSSRIQEIEREKGQGLFTASYIGEGVLKRPILRVDSVGGDPQKRVVLMGSIHGDEVDGAIGLTYSCVDLFRAAKEANVQLTIIPIANVGGYDLSQQGCPELFHVSKEGDPDSINLNRKWPDYLPVAEGTPPIYRLLNQVLTERGAPLVIVSYHADEDLVKHFYNYVFGEKSAVEVALDTALKRHFKPLPVESQSLMGDPSDVGKLTEPGKVRDHHDGSLEDYLSTMGSIAFCIDLPAGGGIKKRVASVRDTALAVIQAV